MKKDIKEQLEKLQYYGEFYAKSDIDDKIKLEELDKSGEISEFGRNFSPQVDHKYTMVISDRRSYLLGNGRGGKDFENFLTTLEKLDNEKYLGLRESLETDPARYHIYTHRGDLLEAFDGIYDEELEKIGTNFGEVYKEVNETIKRGEVDLTDYPDLERAFSDYELKLLDKEIWERDNNYVKFYMDNAYEYLNEKNVLLEEAKMLDVEKHKNVGADMKTVNDGSLLDGLSENVSIPESEKVAGGLDKEAVDEKKLYEIQDKIIENIKNNDNYKEYSCYKVNEYYSSYGLENEHGCVVVPPYSVALTSKEEPDLYGVCDIPENIVLNDEYFKEEKHVEKLLNTDNFNILNCENYEQKYNINMKRSIIWDAAINREKWMNMNQFERYEYANNKNNQIPVDKIKTTEIATYSTSLPIKGLLHADTKFLNKSLDYFNENGKSKEFTVLFDKTHNDFSEDKIKEMLLEENVIDNNIYKEFQDEYLNYHTDQFNKMSTKPEENNSHLDYSEQDFINAINEVNETAQSRIDAKDERLKEEDIDRRFRAVMSKMQSAIIKAEYEEEQAKKSNDQGLIR